MSLLIMLINNKIISIKDQNVDTELIEIFIVATEIVAYQSSLSSSQIVDLGDPNYQVCLKYKKLKLKPVIEFSLLKDFNDVVVANLKSVTGILILHTIDHATRFSAEATVVKSKKREKFIDVFIRHWIVIFEVPHTIISVDGGEFQNDLFHMLGEQFNINVKVTLGESPCLDKKQFWEKRSTNI